MKTKSAAYFALTLCVIEVCLILASWVLSVLFPDCGVRSLLGSEGIRWFLGRFADMLSGKPLAWLLLLSIAFGSIRESGLCHIFRHGVRLHYRERIARCFVVGLFFVWLVLFVGLAFIPNAVLLSATGGLFPSPFSASFVPVVAFGLCLMSVVYGIVSGRFRSVADGYKSLFTGIGIAAPLFLYYILLIQLYYSAMFVFG